MRRLGLICVIALAGAGLLAAYRSIRFTAGSLRIQALEREKAELHEYVRRLSSSRRVAQVTVIDQWPDAGGVPISRLRWQEVASNGLVGSPIDIEVAGAFVYFEGLVLKFDHELVGRGDLERGASLAAFRRLFGERQAPNSAPLIDASALHRAPGTEQSRIEERFWGLFWDFVDRPELAAEYGVRVAQCEAPAVPVRAGQVWEVTLDAIGGLNLRKVAETGLVAPGTRTVFRSRV